MGYPLGLGGQTAYACETPGVVGCVPCALYRQPPNPGRDPHGIPQHEPGAKLDAEKILAGCLLDIPRALMAVAGVFTYGAKKYTRGGWAAVPNGIERYTDAMMRHLLATDEVDEESGLLHAAQRAWNDLVALELLLREKEAMR